MPEIAEVETVRRVLKSRILNKPIKKVTIWYPGMILSNIDEFKSKLINESFIDIKRRGKYLLLETNKYYLISHLRMEGKYYIKTIDDPKEKHEHVEFLFNDNTVLRYKDVRKFGIMKLINKDELDKESSINKLGPEPLSNSLTIDTLYNNLIKKNTNMKTSLLDQEVMSGLGNIYADEVLFASRISPFRIANTITKEEVKRIIDTSNRIISKAIEEGGTTIRSYTSSIGVEGNYQNFLQVHKREGMPCNICNTKITRTKLNGRSTYYCPKCQSVTNKEVK